MNRKAYYGAFGGQYVAESLMNTLEELDAAFEEATAIRNFSNNTTIIWNSMSGERPRYITRSVSVKSTA